MERKINRVKIKQLEIIKLYNMYDHKIVFNEDITFLHGKNGCGKTTILNIITYIITGKIYELFSYDYESITLIYKEKRKNEKIIFTKLENNIEILFKGEKVYIHPINIETENEEPIRIERRLRYSSRIEEKYFTEYPILQKIKDLFDFVYIPLNRNDLGERERFALYRRYRYSKYREEPIYNIANIILDNYARIKGEISNLGKDLQINIVKAMYQYNIDDYINALNLKENAAQEDIDNFKKANLYDEELEKQITTFYNKLTKNNDIKHQEIEYIFNAGKLAQLNKIRKVFNDYDEKVKQMNEPIDKLEKIVNRFFEDSAEQKKLGITENDIFFTTEHNNRKVALENLSSGEKQILILFTYLIFDVANKHNPIFIIDEPELSLHLLWQKNFVRSVLETNPDMQLILATHAPEIIDKYRDKTYKVELNITNNEE